MTFKPDDAVMHPIRGAGVVEGVEEREWLGSRTSYYRIALIYPPGTGLWIPVSTAEEVGLRCAISPSKLDQVWRVLRDDPEPLPDDHRERYRSLEQHLSSGHTLQIAKAVRDLAWRQKQRGRQTGQQLYDRGMQLLAGEIAVTQGVSLVEAEAQIHARLNVPPR